MKRILVLLTAVALMAMLAVAASSAMVDRTPEPPSPGEPKFSGKLSTFVIRCGPFLGLEDAHGAFAINKNGSFGHCVTVPPPH
jgi:hypothetical protein